MDNYRTEKRNQAIEWAKKIKNELRKYLIFDTETTGIDDDDVIIHFAVMDLEGNMLINTPVNPGNNRQIHPRAEALHGYSMEDLKNAPSFFEVFKNFKDVAKGKTVLIYNSTFHMRLFNQTMDNEGVGWDGFKFNYKDVRKRYCDFIMEDMFGLPGRTNTGEGDCKAVLKVLQTMWGADDLQAPEHNLPEAPPKIVHSPKEPLQTLSHGAANTPLPAHNPPKASPETSYPRKEPPQTLSHGTANTPLPEHNPPTTSRKEPHQALSKGAALGAAILVVGMVSASFSAFLGFVLILIGIYLIWKNG